MRILFTFAGGYGHFEPLIPIARAAAHAGHTVAVAGRASLGPTIEVAGFTAFPTWPPFNGAPPKRLPLLPVDLDRSARRDLAALLRRTQLRFTGLDLWIPSEHFVDSARVQRATEATMAAIDLAADLARLVESPRGGLVGIALPAAVPPALVQTLCAYAESRGVDLADHTVRDTRPDARLGVGLDPAGLLLAGQDPVALAARWGTAVQCARLSDASAVGRVAVAGAGSRLDVRAYRATLDVLGYSRNVVVDVRGVRDQVQALMRAREVWDPAP